MPLNRSSPRNPALGCSSKRTSMLAFVKAVGIHVQIEFETQALCPSTKREYPSPQ